MTSASLLRVQAVSGTIFLGFVLVHLTNTAFALGGPEDYNAFQRATRAVYQNPVVELVLLMVPLVVHFAAAIVRLSRDGFRRPRLDWRARLHRYTGYYLMTVVSGHVLATRGPSFFLDFHPGFEGVAFSLWWQPLTFYPYYTLFALAALYHSLNGLSIALGTFGVRVPRLLRSGPGFWVPIAGAGGVLFLAILALGGLLFEIPDPTANEYAKMWNELLGVDLSP